MHQFSVYSKLLLNDTANKAMLGRLRTNNPKKGIDHVIDGYGKTICTNGLFEWREGC